MSVLVKDMEMPKSCRQCFMRIGGCTRRKYNQGRPSDCPLIDIPPHGRLIDAERLKEVFHRNVASGEVFDQLIDIAPTIIEAEGEA